LNAVVMHLRSGVHAGAVRRGPSRWRPHLIPLMLVGLSACIYIAAALYTGQYAQLSLAGVMGLVQRTVALGLVALGQNFVILGGSIDLSVANLVSVSAVMASYVMQGDPQAVPYAVAAVLAIAALIGTVNGLLISRLRVSPLIATLGVGLVLQGVLSVAFTRLHGSVPRSFQTLAYGNWAGIPIALFGLAAVVLVASVVLTRTVAGAHLFAVGGNADSARLSGIDPAKVLIGAHVASALMCGLAGLYLVSWLGAGTPWVGRDGGYDLDSIAAVVVGGTLLAGGKGGVAGPMAGVFTFATIDAVFNMLQIDPFLSQVLRGGIVVVAVGLYTFRSKEQVA
jgi:ribose transport system permease protein